MRKRLIGSVSAAIAVVALMAACSAGGGTAAPATLGAGTPSSTSAASTVTAVSPASGSLVGGEKVTIRGRSLAGVDRVTFNGVDADEVTVVRSTTVTAIVPGAVGYRPSSGAVAVFRGSSQVPSAPLSYTWSVQNGVDKEMQYAFAHWNADTYNAAYINFNSVGGDCQNFVSQALLARGLAQNASWYYDAAGAHSESWGYAPSFDAYLAGTPSLGFTRLDSTQRSQLSVGDLAYFDWNDNGVPDHVMIVSKISGAAGQTKVSLVGHNLDYDYRDLDTAITKDHPGAKVWFYKVPAL